MFCQSVTNWVGAAWWQAMHTLPWAIGAGA